MASIKVILYGHKTLKDGSHPIIIQIIKDRKRKTISTGRSALTSQWNDRTNLPNSKHPNQQLLISRIKRIKADITDVILTLENKKKEFTVSDIVMSYQNKKTDITFNNYSAKLIDTLKKAGKNGNAIVYQSCLESINDFTKNKDIRIDEIDYLFIKRYIEYLEQKETILYKGTEKETKKKLTTNGISFYLRTLRAIINKAIKEDLIEESSYPFKNISIKTQKTRKRAVNKDVIKMVEELDVSKEDNLQLYKDLFMFSFYNRGMNFVDMAYLKVENIEGVRLIYTRQKTGQQFSIKITDKAKAIIDKYNNLKVPESYIFPIIYRKDKEYLDYRNAMRLMNKKLKKISELLKLDVPLTTYVTRHSWATIAKKQGISTAVISEGLGHESEETTQVYLDSFENDVLDHANELIIR